MAEPLTIVLEFTRTDTREDAYAFRFEPQDYALRSPGGERDRFRIEWSEALLDDLSALRRPQRDPELVQRLGELLRRSLAAGWREPERLLLAAAREGRRVHITLRSNAAELFALPWELLTVGVGGQHLGGQHLGGQHLGEMPEVAMRYEWPDTETAPASPSPRPEGGRILLAWSAAGGSVPASEHIEAVESSSRSCSGIFERTRDVLADASARTLADALERGATEGEPYAVVHLLCHGAAAGESFGLALDDGQVIDAGRLRQLIAPHASSLRMVVIATCDGGNIGALGNQLGSVAQALHRAGVQSVIASRYPLSRAGSITLTTALYRSLLVELRSLERALTEARCQLARDAGTLDWASVQLNARASDGDDTRPVVLRPFRGLEVFEAQHRRLFFGREAEADEAVAKIEALARSDAPRMFFVSGASGSGKSSLARAAVLPRLRPRFAEVVITRAGDLADRVPKERPLLLMLDQAEELFTVLDADARSGRIEQLYALATDEAGSVVLFTLRADFIGRCGEVSLPDGRRLEQLESTGEHRVYLPVMHRAGMTEAITGPATLAGLRLQEGLAALLVDEVAGEPGSLPLLEFALDRMWLARDPKHGLTLAGYRALGGVDALLEREADALIEDLGDEARAEARRLLVQLVATGEGQRADTRRKRSLADLRPAEPEVFDDVLARLSAARLVVTSGDTDPQVEIAHEELLRRWGRLRGWVEADRQKWIEIKRVRAWEHLLRGAQLARAQEVRKLYGAELGEGTLVHIGESERVLAEEEAREQRRQRALRSRALVAGGMAVVAIAVAIIALFFFVQANEATTAATKETDNAKKETDNAKKERDNAKKKTARARAETRDMIRKSRWASENNNNLGELLHNPS